MTEGDVSNVGVRYERLVAGLVEAAGEEFGSVFCHAGREEEEGDTNKPAQPFVSGSSIEAFQAPPGGIRYSPPTISQSQWQAQQANANKHINTVEHSLR